MKVFFFFLKLLLSFVAIWICIEYTYIVWFTGLDPMEECRRLFHRVPSLCTFKTSLSFIVTKLTVTLKQYLDFILVEENITKY